MNAPRITPSLAISELGVLLNEYENSARHYAEGGNVNDRYLARLNHQLRRFHESLASLKTLRHLLVWEHVDDKLTSLRENDPTISGIVIQITLSENSTGCPALFDINLARS